MLIEYLGCRSSACSRAWATRRHGARVWKPSVIELAAAPLEWRWKTVRIAVEKRFSKICAGTWAQGAVRLAGSSRGGWSPPHSAVCKELFSSPGIICGSARWDINSFWHGGEEWEHLKGLICHSLSWEGKKNVLPPRSPALRRPGVRLLCIIFMLRCEMLQVAVTARHALYLPLVQTEAR